MDAREGRGSAFCEVVVALMTTMLTAAVKVVSTVGESVRGESESCHGISDLFCWRPLSRPAFSQKCKKSVPSTRRGRNCSFGDLGWFSETLQWGRKTRTRRRLRARTATADARCD